MHQILHNELTHAELNDLEAYERATYEAWAAILPDPSALNRSACGEGEKGHRACEHCGFRIPTRYGFDVQYHDCKPHRARILRETNEGYEQLYSREVDEEGDNVPYRDPSTYTPAYEGDPAQESFAVAAKSATTDPVAAPGDEQEAGDDPLCEACSNPVAEGDGGLTLDGVTLHKSCAPPAQPVDPVAAVEGAINVLCFVADNDDEKDNHVDRSLDALRAALPAIRDLLGRVNELSVCLDTEANRADGAEADRDAATAKLAKISERWPDHCYRCERPCKYSDTPDPQTGAARCEECIRDIQTQAALATARRELEAERKATADWQARQHETVTQLFAERAQLAAANGLLGEAFEAMATFPNALYARITAHLRGEATVRESRKVEPASGGVRWYVFDETDDSAPAVQLWIDGEYKGTIFNDASGDGVFDHLGHVSEWRTDHRGNELSWDQALAHIGTDPAARLALWQASGEVLPVWCGGIFPAQLAFCLRACESDGYLYYQDDGRVFDEHEDEIGHARMLKEIRNGERRILTAQEADALLAQARAKGGEG